jgi:hypothetical protein
MPIALQKSPLTLPVSDALTAFAVCTRAPEVGRPIADAGIEKPFRPAQTLASIRTEVSSAAWPGVATPIKSANSTVMQGDSFGVARRRA